MRLSKPEAADMLGFGTLKQMEAKPAIMKMAKKEGRAIYFEQSDIEEYLRRQRITEAEKKDKPLMLMDWEWGDFENYLLKFIRHNHRGSFFLYCKDLENNIWADSSENFFNDSPYSADIDKAYEQYITLHKTSLLWSEKERTAGIIIPLSKKWKKLKDEIITNYKFAVDEIVEFSNDKSVMKYVFFDLDNLKEGQHKHWSIWEKQLKPEDVSIYRAFIYSIFVSDAKGRQVLWLYDGGKRGKTMTMNAIANAGGGKDFCSSPKKQQLQNQFFGTYFAGKRLVIMDDMEDPFLLNNTIIKSLTGGGRMAVEKKGEKPYDFEPNLKVIIGSNIKPVLSGLHAEDSRLILVEVMPPKQEDFEYMKTVSKDLVNILKDEFFYYLNTCKEAYELKCPYGGDIELDENQLRTISLCHNPEVSVVGTFFTSFFETDSGSYIEHSIVRMAAEHYKNKSGSEIKFDRLLWYFNSHDIRQETYADDKGLKLVRYEGLKLNKNWRVEGSRLVWVSTDTKKEEDFDL